jgi:hypothetical protein
MTVFILRKLLLLLLLIVLFGQHPKLHMTPGLT